MTREEHDAMVERIRLACEMSDAGVEMMRLNLRRRHPTETEAQIAARLEQWVRHRPGAEHGDAEGRPVDVAERFGSGT